ncbi:MAG: hypothetical protein Solivirus5_10 [Solivirus sp.]|uniref:Uncharacterized protein n=1 Tax=Solivirus sp. TaxID=2487772 RepID=A0A3G5AFX6_9VIRU|nr:MAG: hypothetical protein Solivirus5_10 [Solivirus sp.]
MSEEDKYICRCCDENYINESWDFHNLCHNCFWQFDKQKMAGRFNYLSQKYNTTDLSTLAIMVHLSVEDLQKHTFYTESVKEYIDAKICNHTKTQ